MTTKRKIPDRVCVVIPILINGNFSREEAETLQAFCKEANFPSINSMMEFALGYICEKAREKNAWEIPKETTSHLEFLQTTAEIPEDISVPFKARYTLELTIVNRKLSGKSAQRSGAEWEELYEDIIFGCELNLRELVSFVVLSDYIKLVNSSHTNVPRPHGSVGGYRTVSVQGLQDADHFIVHES